MARHHICRRGAFTSLSVGPTTTHPSYILLFTGRTVRANILHFLTCAHGWVHARPGICQNPTYVELCPDIRPNVILLLLPLPSDMSSGTSTPTTATTTQTDQHTLVLAFIVFNPFSLTNTLKVTSVLKALSCLPSVTLPVYSHHTQLYAWFPYKNKFQ